MKRIRTAKGRKVSSTRWLERQLNDPYVQRAKAENYRSRAAYKLLELDERFGLLKGVKSVVDLGIAPGGWSQVVRRRSPQAQVVGIDFLPTEPIDGVAILQMDFMDEAAPDKLREALGGPADLVLSDMAANTVGHQQTDHLRTMALVEAGLEFARECFGPAALMSPRSSPAAPTMRWCPSSSAASPRSNMPSRPPAARIPASGTSSPRLQGRARSELDRSETGHWPRLKEHRCATCDWSAMGGASEKLRALARQSRTLSVLAGDRQRARSLVSLAHLYERQAAEIDDEDRDLSAQLAAELPGREAAAL